MAECLDAKQKIPSEQNFLGGPFKTKADAEAAIAGAIYLLAYGAGATCQGNCKSSTDECQIAIDEWDPSGVKGPFYAQTKDGPGWYYKIPKGEIITYHCECLPKVVIPIGGSVGTGGSGHAGTAEGTDDAQHLYAEMKTKYGASWKCTPEEWKAIYNSCRTAGGSVILCASLASAQCILK